MMIYLGIDLAVDAPAERERCGGSSWFVPKRGGERRSRSCS